MLTYEEANELYNYDPETGIMTRKDNRHLVISECPRGYCSFRLKEHKYLVHRMAHLLMTGEWPREQMDHEDRDPSNNKWKNIRDVSASVNQHNTGISSNNTSGCKGVSWDKKNSKYRSSIIVKGKTHNLGRFPDIEDAIMARKQAEIRLLGYNPC